jgi:hypothetical protein
MRRLFSLLILLLFVGCSNEAASPQRAPADQESASRLPFSEGNAGAAGIRCTVQKAYRYTGTLPFEDRYADHFVAVVVELTGYSDSFDLDDIDLIDAGTNENLGSYPFIRYLRAVGTPYGPADWQSWPKSPGPATLFLLYGRDAIPQRIKLGYWGSDLVDQSVEVAAEGPAFVDYE